MRATKKIIILIASGLIVISCTLGNKSKSTNSTSALNAIDNPTTLEDSKKSTPNCTGNPCHDSVSLNDENYTGSYLIADKRNRYQSIYSSQNYETFYEIYVHANFHDKGNINKVESFEFRIVNYRGPLNIGFAKLKGQPKDSLHFNETEGVIGLKLFLQGNNNMNYMTYKVPDTVNITKDNVQQINIYRMLIPLNGTSLVSMSGKKIFDSEFFERSGLDIRTRPIVPEGHYRFLEPNDFGPDVGDIAQPNFFESIIKTKDGLGTLSKDSNCYTSTMYVE